MIHLHVHSHYSLLEAIGKPKDYIAKAAEYGMKALALTDYSSLYGAITFYDWCKAHDIKPIIWVDIHMVPDIHNKTNKHEIPWTITLLAKNYNGYQQLLWLISHANMEWFHSRPRIDISLLNKYNKNLLCFVWWPDSIIWTMLQHNEWEDKIQERILQLQSCLWKENVYLEYIIQDEQHCLGTKHTNTYIRWCTHENDLSIMCSPNVRYVHKQDKKAFETGLAIKDGKRMFDEQRRTIPWDHYFMSSAEVKEIMARNGISEEEQASMIQTNQDIADNIDIQIPLDTILFPNYQSSPDIVALYEKRKNELIEER